MTKNQWQSVIKPAFLADMLKLPPKEVHQVMDKINILTQDPHPDGKTKKLLTHVPGRPYRIRSGKYRIFYTYNNETVCIFKIDERSDDTYTDVNTPEQLPSSDVLSDFEQPDGDVAPTPDNPTYNWETLFSASSASKPLPEPITIELLQQLHIPPEYHKRLLAVTDQDSLLSCPGVDDDTLLKINDYMFERPLIQVMQEPSLVLNEVDDLLRYKEGELLAFLLKLSPEQEKYATWSLHATGPTLVKGGPGTGKSTVALYRVRSLLTQLLASGQHSPRVLFTTYTHALVKSSQQLLQQLLGPDMRYVQVETADSIAHSILTEFDQVAPYEIIANNDLYKLTDQAIQETTYEGNLLQQKAQMQSIYRLSRDYLLQEINGVIVARQLDTLDAYLATPRAGRKLRLTAMQRTAIWRVYVQWQKLLEMNGKETWQQRRARALRHVQESAHYQKFDAVIIDEAQDLDPTILRMLVQLCQSSSRFFITADANQTIYNSTFNWSDVHADLRFQGRTSILRANYRSTFEIGEATESYLNDGVLETELVERRYLNNGPLPDARTVLSHHHEIKLLISYFQKATRSLRHTIGSCAVLTPTDKIGQGLAVALQNKGMEATFMSGRDLDLSRPGIKVMTLRSSKGLEFPIVALAGFTLLDTYPVLPSGGYAEEVAELLQKERRTLYVGMTRAMRALLVIVPQNLDTPILRGFDPKYWNFHRRI